MKHDKPTIYTFSRLRCALVPRHRHKHTNHFIQSSMHMVVKLRCLPARVHQTTHESVASKISLLGSTQWNWILGLLTPSWSDCRFFFSSDGPIYINSIDDKNKWLLFLNEICFPHFGGPWPLQIDHIQDQIQTADERRECRKIIQLRRKFNHLEISTLHNSMTKLLTYFHPCLLHSQSYSEIIFCVCFTVYRFPLDNQTFYGHLSVDCLVLSLVDERNNDCNWIAFCNRMTWMLRTNMM